MKMFPHSFAPLLHVHLDTGAPKASGAGNTAEPQSQPGCDLGEKPIKIDLEKAVAIILGAREDVSDRQRQKVRLDVMKTLPSESIDWDTVDWVAAYPFRSARHAGE